MSRDPQWEPTAPVPPTFDVIEPQTPPAGRHMTADRWGDDQLFEEAAQLTRAQIALRDNEAPPPPNAGAARARRIEAIKSEVAACQAFIDDCDRQADDLKTTSCIGTDVPRAMRDYLGGLRAYQVSRKLHLEAERDAKRLP